MRRIHRIRRIESTAKTHFTFLDGEPAIRKMDFPPIEGALE